jgi:predicted NACHT family NTPase
LLGDAGSGKTTILRHLALTLARARLKKDTGLARRQTGLNEKNASQLPCPLFIPLRDCHHFCRTKGREINWRSFMDFLPYYFASVVSPPVELKDSFFQTLLNSGRCLLILDGFDEVPDSDHRYQLTQVVRALANHNEIGRNVFILSSRDAAYGKTAHLGGEFQTLRILPLTAEERTEQIKHWVEAVSAETHHPLKADEILSRIEAEPSLNEVAVTPMVITTICIAYYHALELPEQRALLYNLCVEIILDDKLHRDTEAGKFLAELGGDVAGAAQAFGALGLSSPPRGKVEY